MQAPVPKRAGGLRPWQTRVALEYVESQLDCEVTVVVLSKKVGLSTAHFARAFKISLGVSPGAYIAQRRLERAKFLLTVSTETLAQLALACGYSDQAHLSRAFHRRVGISPSVWRRLHGCVPVRERVKLTVVNDLSVDRS